MLALAPASPIVVDEDYLDDIARAFAQIIDAKSPFTSGHSERVAVYADMIAAELGCTLERRRWLKRAALLHDVGKLGVSNAILDKNGKLDEAEWRDMRNHAMLSETILTRVAAFRELARIGGDHHERLDGKGYPRGLAGEAITFETRIVSVADVFDALTADRPYRAAMPWTRPSASCGPTSAAPSTRSASRPWSGPWRPSRAISLARLSDPGGGDPGGRGGRVNACPRAVRSVFEFDPEFPALAPYHPVCAICVESFADEATGIRNLGLVFDFEHGAEHAQIPNETIRALTAFREEERAVLNASSRRCRRRSVSIALLSTRTKTIGVTRRLINTVQWLRAIVITGRLEPAAPERSRRGPPSRRPSSNRETAYSSCPHRTRHHAGGVMCAYPMLSSPRMGWC